MYRLMDEFLSIFTDSHVHIGTDETPEECYRQAIASAGAEDVIVDSASSEDQISGLDSERRDIANSTTPRDMFSKWVNTMHQHITETHPGKQIVMWDEALKVGPPLESSVIQVWHEGGDVLKEAYDRGYKILYSPQGKPHDWYLDHLDVSWEEAYTNPVIPEFASKENRSQFIGGEGCMWGETVDASDFESTVWPRLSAISERLWAPAGVTDAAKALPRLKEWRCLMLTRGVGVNPLGVPGRSAPIYDDFDMSCGAVPEHSEYGEIQKIYAHGEYGETQSIYV